jgi:glycosyltransferase involved in cell wall biosynthesis
MNIGVDTRCLMNKERTGVAEYTFELINALFEIDKENQYLLFYNSSEDVAKNVELWKQENVHYVGTRWPNKVFNTAQVLLGWPKLDKLVEGRGKGEGGKRTIDIWFSPNLNFSSVSSKTKLILTIHDLSFEILPECFSAKRRLWHRVINPKKQCQRADLILVPSENTARDVEGIYGINSKKIRVVEPGLCTNFKKLEINGNNVEIRNKYNLPEKFILFLGTVEPRKNILGIIEGFKNSELLAIGYELVIAGAQGWKSGPIMEKINNTPGVKYIGYVNEEEKRALYELADLFVYPSLYEGFGFPVLEAMASGTPVIASNRSSLPEVVGDAAVMVNPYNTAELSRAMEQVLKDNAWRDILIKRGKERVNVFGWQRTAREFLNLLKICNE